MVDPTPTLPIDLATWRAACAGDEPARTALVDRAWTSLQFRVRRFAAGERDELRQRIALAVLRAIASGVEPQHNLDAFLEWRGRAEITGYVRDLAKARRFQRADEVLELAGHDPAPFAGTGLAELRQTLTDCIDKVPNQRHRNAVRARLLDEREPRHIAAEAGIAVELVRVWISRAAMTVRNCVECKLATRARP